MVLGEGPAWGDESSEGMTSMVAALEQYGDGQEPDTYFAFGYAQAQATHQVLEAAVENGDLSHEGILEAMESIDVFEYGGLFGDYEWGAAEDRNPPRATTISAVDIEGSPTGLTPVVTEYESEAAAAYEFDE